MRDLVDKFPDGLRSGDDEALCPRSELELQVRMAASTFFT
jgi:hypothetical protein